MLPACPPGTLPGWRELEYVRAEAAAAAAECAEARAYRAAADDSLRYDALRWRLRHGAAAPPARARVVAPREDPYTAYPPQPLYAPRAVLAPAYAPYAADAATVAALAGYGCGFRDAAWTRLAAPGAISSLPPPVAPPVAPPPGARPLMPGWAEALCQTSGRPYFYNIESKKTTWNRAHAEVPPPPPPECPPPPPPGYTGVFCDIR